MENKALLWFKPEKTGWLLLRQGVFKEQHWRKLHCMIKGNYLYYIRKLNRPEPQGILPLEGCVAEISHNNNEGSDIYCFIVIMKKQIMGELVLVRSSYLFAAESTEECQCWVDAINIAAVSTHIARLKLEFANQEVKDLLTRVKNLQSKDARRLKDKDSNHIREEEDPLVLQALVNELMELYHFVALAEACKVGAQKQIHATHCYIAKLQEAKMMLDEQIDEQMKTLIQSDLYNVKKQLKHVTSLRCSLRDIAKEIEVLNGNHEYGPQVHVMAIRSSVLQKTLKEIQSVRLKEDIFAQKVELPNEGELFELCKKVNAIYENERIILQAALPTENIEVISQQSRHYFCSLFSYALVPNLENHVQPKQGVQKILELNDAKKGWWSFIHKHFPFINSYSKKNMVVDAKSNNAIPNFSDELEESKYQLSTHKESILLPHLEMGVKESILSNSILSNKKHSEIKINEKGVKDDEQNEHSFSFTNENLGKFQENKEDIEIVEQKNGSILITIENGSEAKNSENDINNIKEKEDLLSDKDKDIHIMPTKKKN